MHLYCKSDSLCVNKNYKVNILEFQADNLGLTTPQNSCSARSHDTSLLQKLVTDRTLKKEQLLWIPAAYPYRDTRRTSSSQVRYSEGSLSPIGEAVYSRLSPCVIVRTTNVTKTCTTHEHTHRTKLSQCYPVSCYNRYFRFLKFKKNPLRT